MIALLMMMKLLIVVESVGFWRTLRMLFARFMTSSLSLRSPAIDADADDGGGIN